jgi:hypothetical protein
MVKLFGWERKMSKQVSDCRDEELRALLKKKLMELLWANIKYAFS